MIASVSGLDERLPTSVQLCIRLWRPMTREKDVRERMTFTSSSYHCRITAVVLITLALRDAAVLAGIPRSCKW